MPRRSAMVLLRVLSRSASTSQLQGLLENTITTMLITMAHCNTTVQKQPPFLSQHMRACRSRVACAEEIGCLIEREGPKAFSGEAMVPTV